MSTVDKLLKELDQAAKKGILEDEELHQFLSLYIPIEEERNKFIRNCLRKMKTRRMLLRLHWYSQLADDIDKAKQSRPALQIIFLMAMAEGLVGEKHGDKNLSPRWAINDFFSEIGRDDKQTLQNNIRRSVGSPVLSSLRFSSIVSILYEVRNKAVHGKEYWQFSLADDSDIQGGIIRLTHGWLGKPGKKRMIPLDVKITYQMLRDVFARTAINNIQSVL